MWDLPAEPVFVLWLRRSGGAGSALKRPTRGSLASLTLSPVVHRLIQACWASEARLRPTFSMIIERLEEIEEYMLQCEKQLRDGHSLSQLWGLPGMLHHQPHKQQAAPAYQV
jgi:hypothetical protein